MHSRSNPSLPTYLFRTTAVLEKPRCRLVILSMSDSGEGIFTLMREPLGLVFSVTAVSCLIDCIASSRYSMVTASDLATRGSRLRSAPGHFCVRNAHHGSFKYPG